VAAMTAGRVEKELARVRDKKKALSSTMAQYL
jgi:hypothetical protein